MNKQMTRGLVIKQRRIREQYHEMEFIAPLVAEAARPGQFVHVRVGAGLDPLLRRPFSIADVDKKQGTVTLLYRVVGKGTDMLSRIPVESELDIIGPLGRGFSMGERVKSALLVGGGIGVAPLFYLARELKNSGIYVHALLGAASSQHLLGKNRMLAVGAHKVSIATDDGSLGIAGRVTDLVPEALSSRHVDFYYACGPLPMLKEMQALGSRYALEGELSLEANMACGVGACLGCSHPVIRNGELGYARVCVEGPVFPAKEVVFDG